MKEFLKKLIIVIASGFLNYFFCFFAQQILGLPIFFDTVIVMAVLFIYGLTPALFTMVIHFVISCIRDYMVYKTAPYVALYMLSGFAIILVTWLFIRRKDYRQRTVNETFLFLMCAACTSAFASCFIGGIVNTVIIRNFTLDENWQGMLLSLGSLRLNLTLSLIIGRIPLTCLDRVITTFTGYGIFYLYRKISNRK